MTKISTLHNRFMKDAGYRREYEALEPEYVRLLETAFSRRPNVFAELGLPNADMELVRAQLTLQIYKIVKTRGLTQAQASAILGIKQPHVSALMRNRAGNFSVGRLMEFLTALGQDVRITVKPTRKTRGEMQVMAE